MIAACAPSTSRPVAVAEGPRRGRLGWHWARARPIGTPDVANTLSDAADSLGAWTYVAIPALAFLETGAFVGLVVPGETAIVVGGVVAERGEVSLPALIGLVWVAAVAGDTVSFLLGRRFGRPFLDAMGAVTDSLRQVERVEGLFDRHGGKVVLVGRFVGILRALTPFVAGASRFPLRRFLPYTAVGALGWVVTFTLVGYGFSESFESAGKDAARIALAGALVVGTVMLVLAVRSGRARGTDAPAASEVDDARRLLLVVNEHARGWKTRSAPPTSWSLACRSSARTSTPSSRPRRMTSLRH